MTQSKTGRKALALFLAMMMLFSLLPASAMAEDPVTEEEIIEEGNEDSFIEDEIFEEEIIEEEPVYEEELFFEEEQPAEETEEVDEEAGLSLTDSETFDGPPSSDTGGGISAGEPSIKVDPVTADVWDGSADGGLTIHVTEIMQNNYRVRVSGEVTLIIDSGVTLDVPMGITVPSGATLTINDGSQYTGTLIAGSDTMDNNYSGIGADSEGGFGTITINGGTINATGKGDGAGIGGGNGTVNINGGTVIAQGGNYGIKADGANNSATSITIADSNVNATGSVWGIQANGVLTIDNSTVTAEGQYGIAPSSMSVTGTGSDVIAKGTESAYNISDNAVTIGEGLVVRAGDSAPGSKITDFGTNHQQKYVRIYAALEPVSYIDKDGSPQTCDDYVLVVSGAEWSAADPDWFVLKESQIVNDRITVTGNVNLILCDGATLTASKGINVSDSNSLTIYGQSNGSGELVATGAEEYAGIGGHYDVNSGTIKIYGGKITANGGKYAAGIGGGGKSDGGSSGTTFEIYNATVTATGGDYGAGIGGGLQGSLGAITIGSGTVTATGGLFAAGIGAGDGDSNSAVGGTVTINGGEVFATGGGGTRPAAGTQAYAAGIGGNAYGTAGGTVELGSGMIAYAGEAAPGVYVADYAGTGNHSQPYAHVSKGTAPAPTFADTHMVNLGADISLWFKLILPEGFSADNSYVNFSVASGKTSTVDIDTRSGTEQWAICPINVLELADTITATYHYTENGTEKTTSQDYSVMEYMTKLRDSGSCSQQLLDLLDALLNYGYYIRLSGWTDNRSHASFNAAKAISDIPTVRSATASYQLTKGDIASAGITNVKFSLIMNAQTAINVSVKPAEGTTITGGTERMIGEDTYYQFAKENIGPKDLDAMFPFKIETSSGTATINASALSYVYAVVKEGSTVSGEKQNAMAAFYDYYAAAEAYSTT